MRNARAWPQQCWKSCANGSNIVALRFGDHGTKEMLGVVGWKVWPVSNFAQQHATTSNNMQQGVQTDVTCNIQQCWELLANNVGSFCTGLKTQSSSKKKPFKHPRVQWRKLSNYLGMTSTVLLVLKRGQLITIRFENFFIVMINSKMRRRVGCVLE